MVTSALEMIKEAGIGHLHGVCEVLSSTPYPRQTDRKPKNAGSLERYRFDVSYWQ